MITKVTVDLYMKKDAIEKAENLATLRRKYAEIHELSAEGITVEEVIRDAIRYSLLHSIEELTDAYRKLNAGEKEDKRKTVWVIRGENGRMEAAGTEYPEAVEKAERKSKENGMLFRIM